MNKSYLIAVLTLTCLLGLGISAHAQDAEGVRVKIPFGFVAGGTTFPAGTYTVGRVAPETSQLLSIRSYDNSAMVLPIVYDAAATEHARLDFEHVGDSYFLRGVETPAGVYTIALPRAMVSLAQTKDQGSGSSSGTK